MRALIGVHHGVERGAAAGGGHLQSVDVLPAREPQPLEEQQKLVVGRGGALQRDASSTAWIAGRRWL
ncbi:MAG: hypothetical protein WKF96_10755 [Solirubrobacteraceae bacterium]